MLFYLHHFVDYKINGKVLNHFLTQWKRKLKSTSDTQPTTAMFWQTPQGFLVFIARENEKTNFPYRCAFINVASVYINPIMNAYVSGFFFCDFPRRNTDFSFHWAFKPFSLVQRYWERICSLFFNLISLLWLPLLITMTYWTDVPIVQRSTCAQHTECFLRDPTHYWLHKTK